MAAYHESGRIDYDAFLISTSVLFALVLISLSVRLYIKLAIQRQFGLDDALIVFGVALLIAAMGMLYRFIDSMFLTEAIMMRDASVVLTFDVMQRAFDFQKWITASLIVTWAAITTVKLSFLALFRRLVDRIRPLTIYWWLVLVYTIVVALYGISAYIVPCPKFDDISSLSCSQGPRIQVTLRYSIAQMALDILGDILILVIPIKVIWKVQIQWTQKLALFCSLCLSLVMIAVTLVRASGIVRHETVDATWETYWQYLSAEVGLIMSSATAFRSLFINLGGDQAKFGRQPLWITTALKRLRSIITSVRSSKQSSDISRKSENEADHEIGTLPAVPRPTITGLGTIMRGFGKTRFSSTDLLSVAEEGHPPTKAQIMVSRDIEVQAGDVDCYETQSDRPYAYQNSKNTNFGR